jgi:hypothetical protein
MISLPKMGRPSVSGLSVKALGLAEYKRRYYALHHTQKTSRRWWTGLHSSRMTHAGYMSAWRAQGLNAAGKPKKADNGRTLRK